MPDYDLDPDLLSAEVRLNPSQPNVELDREITRKDFDNEENHLLPSYLQKKIDNGKYKYNTVIFSHIV